MGPVSGSCVGKSASPSSTPGSAFLCCVSVRPSSRQARRTAPPDINGVNALAFGTLFSSQGASADPKEGTPRRWGRATHHGRHASRGRQPNSCPDPALLRFAPRIPAARERSNGRSSRDGKIPVWRERARPVYVRSNTDGRSTDPSMRWPARVPLRRPRCRDRSSLRAGHRSGIRAQGFGRRSGRFPCHQHPGSARRPSHGSRRSWRWPRRSPCLARRRAARAPMGRQPDLGGPRARPTAKRGVPTRRPARASRTSRTQPLALHPRTRRSGARSTRSRTRRRRPASRLGCRTRSSGSPSAAATSTGWSSTRSRRRSSSATTSAGSQLRSIMLTDPARGTGAARDVGRRGQDPDLHRGQHPRRRGRGHRRDDAGAPRPRDDAVRHEPGRGRPARSRDPDRDPEPEPRRPLPRDASER